MNNPNFEHLEELAEKRAEFETLPGRARIRAGLDRLENYSSNLVVAWIEDSSHEVLNSLLKTDFYVLVCEATAFVSLAIDRETDPRFQGAWRKFEHFILRLESNGSKRPEICYVGMFFSVIVLRDFFEVLSEGKVDHERAVQIDKNRYSPSFLSPVMARSKELPISFNIQGKLLQKIDELPAFLDELSRWIEPPKQISNPHLV